MQAVTLWIWICAYLNCAGWTLSALHQLNRGGYAVALTLGLGGALLLWRRLGVPARPNLRWRKWRWRFRRGFPLAFLLLTGLALLGGALYAPNNYDALAYRTPRVLHWLATGQWHWVHTEFQRLNTRTAGFEWLTAPLFLFSGTDRLVFLLNIICFLLLPGRFFAVLTRLGVRPRTAWHWMWLFAGGYGYALQAGSVVNDMFGAMMAFAALEFALRAGRDRHPGHLWTALLAAALMTAAKAFNLLLLLPWLVAALPALPLLLRRPAVSVAILALAASASLLPTAWMNWRQCGDWTGLAAEQPMIGGGGKLDRLLVNTIALPLNNVVPPVFPAAHQWNLLADRLIPPGLAAKLQGSMETELANFHLPEMQVEESAGLGMGLTLLLLALLAARWRAGQLRPPPTPALAMWVILATWASLGVFMLQVGSAGPGRYLLPFYPVLAAPLLFGPLPASCFRRPAWRMAAWAAFSSTALLLILTPARPLWPAGTVLRALDASHSARSWLRRMEEVYSAYGTRANGFAPVLAALPAETPVLGLLEFDEPEAALWRPFGSRRVIQFCHGDTPGELRARGIRYALVREHTLTSICQVSPEAWLQQTHAEVLQRFEFKLLASQPPHRWLLVRFN